MDKVMAVRALASRTALRMIRFITIIFALVLAILFVGIWALAHFFSAWWWLLLIPLIALFFILAIVRFIVRFIAHRLYGMPLTKLQRKQLDGFVDKVARLAETKSTPPVIFAILTIKDILLHRDITTIKGIIRDSASLKKDFDRLTRDLSHSTVIDR